LDLQVREKGCPGEKRPEELKEGAGKIDDIKTSVMREERTMQDGD